MNKTLRSCLYARVSTTTEEQKTSLDYQEHVLREYILNQENETFNPLTDVFYESISGVSLVKKNSKSDKGFNELMQSLGVTIKQDIGLTEELSFVIDKDPKKRVYDKVYVKSISRFSRAGASAQTLIELLIKAGIEIYVFDLNKTLNELSELELSLYIYMASNYSKGQSSSTRMNKIYKTNNGELMLHGERFGWDLIKKEDNKRYYIKNEEQAKIYLLIVDLFLNKNMGCSLIERELRTRGIVDPKGKLRLEKSQIHRLLRDKHSCGYEKYYRYPESYVKEFNNGRQSLKNLDFEWIPCKYIDPIISKEEYDLIQDKMQSRTINKRGFRTHKATTISNLLYCSECGKHFYSLGDKNTFKIQAYKCSSKRFPKDKGLSCNNHILYMDYFNEWATQETSRLRYSINQIIGITTTSLYNLKHHLAALLAPTSPLFDKDPFDILLEEREDLIKQLNNLISILLNSSELTDLVKATFEDKQKELTKKIEDIDNKINYYTSLKMDLKDILNRIKSIEYSLENYPFKETYSLDDFLEELAKVYVCPYDITPRHRNSLVLIPILKIEEMAFNLIDELRKSPLMDLLDKDLIKETEELHKKKYIIKDFPRDKVYITLPILKDLEK